MSNLPATGFILFALGMTGCAHNPQLTELYNAGLALNAARFEPGQTLCLAVREASQADEVSRLLGTIRSPGLKDQLNTPPTYYAAMIDNLPELERLLALGYNTTMPDGGTLLHVAAYWNSVNSARYLLDHGVSLNTPNTAGGTPLMIAVSEGGPDVARLLLSRGARVDSATLRHSLVCKDQAIVNLLLASGVEIDQKTRRVAEKLNIKLPESGR